MIKVRELSSGYNDIEIIRIDCVGFETGKITTILGENGCGKSTFLRAIAGVLPYNGSASVGGLEIRDMKRIDRAKSIAYLPQYLNSPRMTVEQLVMHGRFCRMPLSKVPGRSDIAAVLNAMEQTDMLQLADKNIDELSGGEKQRAYLAMAIAQETPFLLLDEATSHMDIAHQITTIEILKNLCKAGKGIVMTSHDLPQSFTVSDMICLMHKGGKDQSGRIICQGTPEELYAKDNELRLAMGVNLAACDSGDSLYKYNLIK